MFSCGEWHLASSDDFLSQRGVSACGGGVEIIQVGSAEGGAEFVHQDLGMLDSEREEYARIWRRMREPGGHLQSGSRCAGRFAPDARAGAASIAAQQAGAGVEFPLSKGVIRRFRMGITARRYLPGCCSRAASCSKNRAVRKTSASPACSSSSPPEWTRKNEDAVYASEVHRLDHGAVDWSPSRW